ncbi:DUF2254 domain-containing protein [Georgenia faecalis]|uniref:DUF2254 domain-containing protein n=1 Tax=Georgenia faecalis TaxID=2483799 RepID=A0ABV9D8G2_9MICO|nr:DUF2254 domain-containing protein [Georgenia faecalis]
MSERTKPAFALRLAAGAYRFRESLFLLPTLVVAGGLALAALTTRIDDAIGDRPIPLTVSMDTTAATWLVSTVAGAMITTAGVVFSLTVVSLQLASSQFSPRVMRSFIRDRLSQLVIGLLVATFVYCVLTLPSLRGEGTGPAPRVSVTVAIVLAVVTVVAIIAHLDHLAHRLQVGHLARDIAAEGLAVIGRIRAEPRGLTRSEAALTPPASVLRVHTDTGGWVSQVDTARLLAAVPAGTTVRLETRVGAYLHQGEPLVTVWPPPLDDGAERALAAAVAVSDSRTMQQDVDFALRQLVDVGLRALSAAINDPSTAVEVTLRVGGLMRELLVTDFARAVTDGRGRVFVRPWDLDHTEYIAHAFDQLRQAAPPQPQVVAALLRVLRMLIAHVEQAGRPEHVPALRAQIDLLLDGVDAQSGLHPHDVARLHAMAADATDPAEHGR